MKIPELKSRYIPVFAASYILSTGVAWWRPTDAFHYPNVLLNLDTIKPEDMQKYGITKDVFLLTDSGGFQAISGQVNYDWLSSLQKQISLGASKIFSFDKPPVDRIVEGQNIFRGKEFEQYKKQVEDNLDVALRQSAWLKQNNPDKLKDFCYVLHANSWEMLNYNLELIEKKIGGMDKYKDYFGGVSYAIKKSDYIFFTTCAAHAKKHFIDRGLYVHFLGIGSPNKMIILIKNEITTFDSSNALRGAMTWAVNSPIDVDLMYLTSTEYPFTKQFCLCPVCSNTDYLKVMEGGRSTDVGRWFVAHNLWQILRLNTLLDSIDKKLYTKIVRENFRLNSDVTLSLEYIDMIDRVGLEIAYDKFKHYIKEDESKQKSLFK